MMIRIHKNEYIRPIESVSFQLRQVPDLLADVTFKMIGCNWIQVG